MPDVDSNVDEGLVANLRRLFRVEEQDLELIKQVGDLMKPSEEQLLDGLYNHILSFPELAAMFRDDESRQRARAGQGSHLERVLSGTIDEEYIQEGLRVGSVHEALRIEPSGYLSCFAYHIEHILQKLLTEAQDLSKAELVRMCQALAKIVFLDIALVWESYYRRREQRIRDAHKALEASHNLALGMIEQRDREIEELLKTREQHPGSGPASD